MCDVLEKIVARVEWVKGAVEDEDSEKEHVLWTDIEINSM